MGRNKPNKWRRGKRDRDQQQTRPGTRGNYELPPKENAVFEEYYKGQGIVPEGEWDQFMSTLRQELPVTFRITGYRSQAKRLLDVIKSEYFSNLVNMVGDSVQPPKLLPWYPDNLAWQINVSRKEIRSTPLLKKLHTFLVSETESGYISRQEAVSMIPPILLDVQPHHKVLDLCAAPGSKTAQLIELLHADETKAIPEGFVVANDVDNKRCYLMVHQVKRLQSPCFMIVNHDATTMPNIRMYPQEDEANKFKFVTYDRVLADVPCSGDGTMRKNPDVWRKWLPQAAVGLHSVQMKVLKRGLELLSVGGRLVYSTCSLNPVEDEAVISAMLQKCEGSVELVDASDKLPGLKTMPGLKSWKIFHRKDSSWFNSFEEVEAAGLTGLAGRTMFPPSPEMAEQLHLERCMRVLPHHQNTGGFFIAVLEKRDVLPWVRTPIPPSSTAITVNESEIVQNDSVSKSDTSNGDVPVDSSADLPPEGADDADVRKRKQRDDDDDEKEEGILKPPEPNSEPHSKKAKISGYKEDPYFYFNEDEPDWEKIKNFYSVSNDFPYTQLLVRSETGKKRNIYFTSDAVKRMVTYNTDKIRFINTGIKLMARSEKEEVDCDFRLAQEGINTIFPYFTSRRVHITKEDVLTLLLQENPFIGKMSLGAQEELKPISQGSIIFIFDQEDSPDDDNKCRVLFCGWKGKKSCRTFVPKHERLHYLRMCGITTDPKQIRREEEGEMGEEDPSAGEMESSEDKQTEEREAITEGSTSATDTNVEEEMKEGGEEG
ncbi:tRNA (cytosine(34)-C(5))-methyltransferase isoform X2 [Lingula anatina]|uniref:tRNA (cytosine(34)-C(5))-methyltransferase n=1 Tax=Lingula anatina TaxID=7574 RepID=A0A1S3JZT5_LINAN|nr:tRNA (cytosine(34)-C(5))-methyltransferase isoform X2 [Lingula anatina]|eukprot:XP_013415807.1 tRNA (cytosine(34)-C(5))-methyltransferase isoform X2 [Lingula anatina]